SRAPIAMTLPALDGGELDLASWRGRVVVIHVFTTWSMAATADVPQLVAADQRDDVSVVGLALDREGRTTVAPWRRALGVRYLVTLADDAMIAGHSPLGPLEVVPATIVLDRRGVIARRVDRPLADDELPRLIAEAAGTR
ncbi:MAG: TlpA family protein disulfide reductase, partial [Myxococcales bacterium]|nr:TlpA family protein disulfide reductase [Myxococcales bacterium]